MESGNPYDVAIVREIIRESPDAIEHRDLLSPKNTEFSFLTPPTIRPMNRRDFLLFEKYAEYSNFHDWPDKCWYDNLWRVAGEVESTYRPIPVTIDWHWVGSEAMMNCHPAFTMVNVLWETT